MLPVGTTMFQEIGQTLLGARGVDVFLRFGCPCGELKDAKSGVPVVFCGPLLRPCTFVCWIRVTLSFTLAGPDVQHVLVLSSLSVSLSLTLSSWYMFASLLQQNRFLSALISFHLSLCFSVADRVPFSIYCLVMHPETSPSLQRSRPLQISVPFRGFMTPSLTLAGPDVQDMLVLFSMSVSLSLSLGTCLS